MSTLQVNTINAATSGQGVAVDVQNPRSNRRINENGACVIAQRGTSSTSTEFQTVDRWRTTFNGVSVTTTQHALTDADTGPWEKGFRYSYHVANTSTNSGGDARCEFGTRIEAQNICNSGWVHSSTSSYLTYSFWVKSSLAGTYYTWLRSKDSTNKNYVSSFVLVANTWKKVSFTVPGAANVFIDNNNGVGLNVNISPYWGTDFTDSGTGTGSWVTFVSGTRLPDYAQNWCNTANATFEATGLQLEVGEYATEFEHRTYGDELARCQRYFQMIDGTSDLTIFGYGRSNGTSAAVVSIPLTTPLRASPTITCSKASVWSGSASDETSDAPAVTRWTANATVLNLNWSSGVSGFTNARSLVVACANSSNLLMDSEL